MKSPQEIASLLEQGKLEALNTIETYLQQEDKSPSFRALLFCPLCEALRGLQTTGIPSTISKLNKEIENAQKGEEEARLRLKKAKVCIQLSKLRTAGPEIQWALNFYLQDEKAWKKELRACYNLLIGSYFNISEYDRAINYLKKYEKLLDPENRDQRAHYLGMRGRILVLQGKLGLAEKDLLEASEIDLTLGNHTNLIKGYLELSYLYALERKFQESKEFLQRTHNMIKSWNEETIDSIHTNSLYYEFLGVLAYAQGNYQMAYECYQKVFDLLFDMMLKERVTIDDMISQTNRHLAELYLTEKKYDEALIACENGWKAAFEIDQKIEIGAIYRVWGRIYSVRGKKQKAREYFEESISLLDKIGVIYELGLSFLEAGRSNAFENSERITYLNNAKEVFEKIGIKYYVNSASKLLQSLSKSALAPTTGNEFYGP